jgi:CDP-diacylglycerol pyrophosphatase
LDHLIWLVALEPPVMENLFLLMVSMCFFSFLMISVQSSSTSGHKFSRRALDKCTLNYQTTVQNHVNKIKDLHDFSSYFFDLAVKAKSQFLLLITQINSHEKMAEI